MSALAMLLMVAKAIDIGMGMAMYNIGWLYQHGLGVAPNRQLAREWYQRAVAAGSEVTRERRNSRNSWLSTWF